jgi:hypothetical protein
MSSAEPESTNSKNNDNSKAAWSKRPSSRARNYFLEVPNDVNKMTCGVRHKDVKALAGIFSFIMPFPCSSFIINYYINSQIERLLILA